MRRGRKIYGYKNAVLHAKKDAKKRKALEQVETYNALTIDEKLALIATRRGESKKETARLLKQKEESKNE